MDMWDILIFQIARGKNRLASYRLTFRFSCLINKTSLDFVVLNPKAISEQKTFELQAFSDWYPYQILVIAIHKMSSDHFTFLNNNYNFKTQ